MMRPNPRDPTPLETPSPARWLMALVGVAALFGGAGCSPDNICEENPAACPVLSCTPKESAQPVGDGCGVFVSPSLGVGDAVGSKAKPFKTIAAALSVVTTKRIYLCAEEINEAVSLRPGFRVYGGLSCSTGWGRIEEAETILTADPGTIPVTIAGEPITDPDVGPVDPNKIPDAGGGVPEEQAPVLLEDLRIVAKDAEDEGGSSIAVFAYDAVVEMNRCRIEAGNARDGKPGEGVVEAAAAGVSGNPGKAACSADTVLGGDEVANLCSMVMTPSVGGTGGLGTTSGGSGAAGLPDLGANAGAGGVGATEMRPCGAGAAGAPGASGAPGEGSLGAGSIGRSAAGGKAGYGGGSGRDGLPGAPGQGGGGGGASLGGNAPDKCIDMASDGGASGGSGGAGGCGGAGGKGGGPGGSSIGLISLNTKLTFNETTVLVKKGGKGGDGGAGQPGGAGGTGGLGGEVPMGSVLLPGCAGGEGGLGGAGGRGGGGQGGHSIGIAFLGRSPPALGVTIQVGASGVGGAGDGQGGAGVPGKSPKTLRFEP